ncbi:hypothetical protein [Actinocorallia sp. A-T 12471]|uniref:hypothetical protein n=1 Tax=Actinocorallia sp. A-T 12471 TaxID=3089813 RepID=UPI0029D0AEF0|nr:hypothetical protein [Actinocorallia sp. A-T 12471]MDX6738608.1 hypothetical protein [Actinocorallia sp. A-T 12471]
MRDEEPREATEQEAPTAPVAERLGRVVTARQLLNLAARAGAVGELEALGGSAVRVRPVSDVELYADGFTVDPAKPAPLEYQGPLEKPPAAVVTGEVGRIVGELLDIADQVRICPQCPTAIGGLCFEHFGTVRGILPPEVKG